MLKTKIIAFYLPQYHTIPENDEWWGKGFTEWTNVKKARPLFSGHNQPRIPLNGNYYDLMKPETFQWQVDLAKKYNVHGFCFYHYWFDRKLLLEKPLDIWLKHPEFDREFCFSWANEPWTRSWDGLNKNILMPQNYNGEKDIVSHFNYMLPFFKDSRYIKIENKPVFVLYRANSITYLENMVKIWNELALKFGFNGVYFVETLTFFSREKCSANTDAIVYMEPMYVLSKRNFFNKLLSIRTSPILRNQRISYKYLWNKILNDEVLSPTSWAGAFCDWDNSPRKKERNLVVKGVNGNIFSYNFHQLFKRAIKLNSPFIFINAWNEWGEGTYLEPDEKNKYMYLEAIKNIVENL